MPREQRERGVPDRDERLGDAEHHPAEEGAPERSEPADDDDESEIAVEVQSPAPAPSPPSPVPNLALGGAVTHSDPTPVSPVAAPVADGGRRGLWTRLKDKLSR